MLSIRLALWAAAAGALIPIMAVLNARLGRALGEPLHAPVVLFSVGFMALLFAALSLTSTLPNLSKLSQAQPIDFAGGLIVGFYVLSATLVAPRMGVGNFILFAVVAQIVCATLVDQLGLFGAPVRPADGVRIGGIAILILGLVITQLSVSTTPNTMTNSTPHSSAPTSAETNPPSTPTELNKP
jgi:transporter family-2 protein